jgi:hypothetical protein
MQGIFAIGSRHMTCDIYAASEVSKKTAISVLQEEFETKLQSETMYGLLIAVTCKTAGTFEISCQVVFVHLQVT